MLAKLSGVASWSVCPADTAHATSTVVSRPKLAKARRMLLTISGRDEIASRVGQDHVAHRLVIFNVAGATAQMAVKRLDNGLLEVGTRHGIFCQALQQHLPLVQETRGAVAALECEMLDEGFL